MGFLFHKNKFLGGGDKTLYLFIGCKTRRKIWGVSEIPNVFLQWLFLVYLGGGKGKAKVGPFLGF